MAPSRNVDPKLSMALSLALALVVAASMQVFGAQLAAAEPAGPILGGFLGSLVFILLLTAINNFEAAFLDIDFQARLLPEVAIALFAAVAVASTVHGVSSTTCIIFSLGHLFFMSRVSNQAYARKQ